MGNGLSGQSSLAYQGTNAPTPPNITVHYNRPTSNFYQGFEIGDFWVYRPSQATNNNELWVLMGKIGNVANWVLLSNGVGTVLSLTTDDGHVVTPTAGTIIIHGGAGITTSGTVGPNTVTITSLGPPSYSTGVWTPTLTFGNISTGITYLRNTGSYTKIGNVVSITCDVELTSKGAAVGLAAILGLPFLPISLGSISVYSGYVTWDAGYTATKATFNTASAYVGLLEEGSGLLAQQMANTNFANNSAIIIGGTYITS